MHRITHGGMKRVLLFLLVVMMILPSSGLAARAYKQGNFFLIQYINDDTAYQPLAVNTDALLASTVDWEPFFRRGSVPAEAYPYLSQILTDNHRVISMDVSKERIVMLCSDADERVFLRRAVWNGASLRYEKMDTLPLPRESDMDSYHDGNAILLLIPLGTDSTGTEEAESADEALFLTFEQRDNEWVLACFTDGCDFIADLRGTEYIFNDYYEPSDAYEWRTGGPILLAQFDFTALADMIGAYQRSAHVTID